MKIIMTGGSGFLGQYVERECSKHGHTFISYDMLTGNDILNRDDFYTLCSGEQPDVVIHAAAVADLYKSEENLDKNFSINVQGTYYIARICSILHIPIIYISTCCAYGNQSVRRMTDEATEPIPTESYAWSKLAGEKVLGCAGPLAGFILRLGTFYGPGMRDALFNAVAIDKALKGEPITIHGDG
jgi:dTDP-4-dehydrorhamnose reductase